VNQLVQTGMVGEVSRFDVEEGHEFNWPLRTAHIFQDGDSGGVLADTGVHVLDLVLWSLGVQKAQLVRCRADNWGGVETNAEVDLLVEGRSGQASGSIELSFTRKLRNTLRIYGQKGWIEASIMGGHEVFLHLGDTNTRPLVLTPHEAKPRTRVEEFAMQLSNWAESIVNGSRQYVSAAEALMTVSLIEQCHRSREILAQPWETKHLESFFESRRHG
jgi:predicted dehydrogenase